MLANYLVTELFAFLLVFCRVGSAIMLLPGFGEAYVSARARLIFAALFSLLLAPVVKGIPAVPDHVPALVIMMSAEILIGIFIGTLTRIILSAISVAGMIIAYQSSLASAIVQDITVIQGQSTSISNLLGMAALLLLFATDLHHALLHALNDSYLLFAPGVFPLISDLSQHLVETANQSFHVALQMSAPHLVIGIVIYLAAGVIAKLMPNVQVFFIMIAPNLLLSFFLLMIIFSSIIMVYTNFFKDSIARFIAP